MNRLQWYALAVHVRSEGSIASELAARVDDVFLPLHRERRIWSDRVKDCEVPLFPGYIFVRTSLSAQRRVELLKIRGVVDLVGRIPSDGRIARAIPDADLESLRLVVDAERAIDPIARLVPGRAVVVVSGPLRGARGVVEEAPDGHRRLVVQVALLGRGVRAVLAADDVVAAVDVAA